MITEQSSHNSEIDERYFPLAPRFKEDSVLVRAEHEYESYLHGGRLILSRNMIENRLEFPSINDHKPDVVIFSYITMTPGRGPGAQIQRLYDGLAATLKAQGVPMYGVEPETQNNGYHASLPNVEGHVCMDMPKDSTPEEQVAIAHARTEEVYEALFKKLALEWKKDHADLPLRIAVVDVGYDGMTARAVKKAIQTVKQEYAMDLYATVIVADSSYDSGNQPSNTVIDKFPTDVSNPTSFDSDDHVTTVRLALNSSAPDVNIYTNSPSADTHSIFAAAGHPIPENIAKEFVHLRTHNEKAAKRLLRLIYKNKGVDETILNAMRHSDIIDVEMNGQYIDNLNHLERKVQTDEQHDDVHEVSTTLIKALKNIGSGQYASLFEQIKAEDKHSIMVLVPEQYLDMAESLGGVRFSKDFVGFGDSSDASPRVLLVKRQAIAPKEMGILYKASKFIISRSTQMNADAEAKIAGIPVLDIDMPGFNFMWSTGAGRWYGEQGGLSYSTRIDPKNELRTSEADFAMAMLNLLYEPEVREAVIEHQDDIIRDAYDPNSGVNVYNVIKYLLALQ